MSRNNRAAACRRLLPPAGPQGMWGRRDTQKQITCFCRYKHLLDGAMHGNSQAGEQHSEPRECLSISGSNFSDWNNLIKFLTPTNKTKNPRKSTRINLCLAALWMVSFSPHVVSYSLFNMYSHVCFLKITTILITLLCNFQSCLDWRLNARSFAESNF
jgi:hypothetical protein